MTSPFVRWALATALVTGIAGPVAAQKPDIVPSTSFAFLSINVAELWDAPSLKPVREMLTQKEQPFLELIVSTLGVSPNEIERITAFWPNVPEPRGNKPFVVLTTREPFNEAKLLKTLKATSSPEALHREAHEGFRLAPPTQPVPLPKDGALPKLAPPPSVPKLESKKDFEEPIVKRQPIPANKNEPSGEGPDLYYLPCTLFEAMYFIDERTILFIPAYSPFDGGAIRSDVYSLLGQLLRKKADGPLAEALKQSEKHSVVLGVRPSAMQSIIEKEGVPQELTPFKSLFRAKRVVITLDIVATAKVGVQLLFADETQARRAEPVFKTLLQTASEYLVEFRKDLAKQTDLVTVFEPLLELALKSLDKADVKADGSTVVAQAEAEIGPTITKAMAGAPAAIQASSERIQTLNNLKQIGLAIHNYHDTFGHMPTDIVDPVTGKVILSWRVAMLPFIEQENLYKQINLNLPWDNPANKKFLETMPSAYRVLGRETKDKGLTYFQMPSAEKVLEGGSPMKVKGQKLRLTSITDGLSNTLMVVEAADAVLWMKPDDVSFDPKNLPKLGAPGRDKFYAGFGDGAVREFRRSKLSDDTLRGLLTINGGEVLVLDEK